MRFCAPLRAAVDPAVFLRPPLDFWHARYGAWLSGPDWPAIESLSRAVADHHAGLRFERQDPALLADGLHYEERIALQGVVATRPENWHDLLNAMIWLQYPVLKRALNRQQMQEIAQVGTRVRSRVQCALTHFDEAGVMVCVRDPGLLDIWDRHDWSELFVARRQAWLDGSIRCEVFGHALLEHALVEEALVVGKALVVLEHPARSGGGEMVDRLAAAIEAGRMLRDPQELRPLPLSGIPGWHRGNEDADFYRRAPCFRPLRAGRTYPPPLAEAAC